MVDDFLGFIGVPGLSSLGLLQVLDAFLEVGALCGLYGTDAFLGVGGSALLLLAREFLNPGVNGEGTAISIPERDDECWLSTR